MKIYYITGFEGHYPVGTSAIIVANGLEEARKLLNAKLGWQGLPIIEPDEICMFTELPIDEAKAIILNNGDY